MCQKKPGPRCYSHLSKELESYESSISEREQEIGRAEHQKKLVASSIYPQHTKLGQVARAELAAAGNENPTDEEIRDQSYKTIARVQAEVRDLQAKADSLRKQNAVALVKKKDAERLLLGTKTGQELAKQRLTQMHEEGRSREVISNYKSQIEKARKQHEQTLAYAKWTRKVEKGEIPGRIIKSKGTVYSPSYSDDPLYDADIKDIRSMSTENLEMAMSSRHGSWALTPATREKMSDELTRRNTYFGEDAQGAEKTESRKKWLKGKYPEAYEAYAETTYGGNYFHFDTRDENMQSALRSVGHQMRSDNVLTDQNGKTYSYPEVISRATAKIGNWGKGPVGDDRYLLLDNGSKVKVSKSVWSRLRFDGGRTGMYSPKNRSE